MEAMLAKVLVFALVGAVSPILMTEIVVLLATKERPRARAYAFALGAGVFTVGFGILLLTLFWLAHGRDGLETTVPAVLDVVIGSAVVTAAAVSVLRRPRPRKDRERSPRLGLTFLFGVGSMATNFTTLVVFIAAVKEIDRADVGLGGEIVGSALLDVLVLLPVLLPLGLDAVAHEWIARQLARLQRLADSPLGRKVIATVVAGIGVYLIVEGARTL